MKKISTSELPKFFQGIADLFICSASFEKRCLTVAEGLGADSKRKTAILRHKDNFPHTEENLSNLQKLLQTSNVINIGGPLDTADSLNKEILPLLRESKNCIIDITTLTHEQLLILIRVIQLGNIKANIQFTYTGADKYSTNTNDIEEIWLSKGVHETRAVLGYSGIMLPSQKLHLIVLMGYETERAITLIKKYEPARLSLGIAPAKHSIKDEHHKTNQLFFDRLVESVKTLSVSFQSVETFEFYCVDPFATQKQVLEQVAKFSGLNVAICPLNTKLSTIGVGLAAIENENIQVCYAQPIEYNTAGYSSPGNEISIFELPKFN